MPALPSTSDETPSDAELISRAQRGDGDAFAALVHRHIGAVRVLAAMKLPIPHLAEEITHETFVFAFKNLAGFEVKTSFRAWLRAIAFNLARREIQIFARDQQNLSRFEQEQLDDSLHEVEHAGEPDEAVLLNECIELLPENMRRLVQDRYQAGRSNNEIATAWQRTSEWVRVTLLRVRRQLRDCIEQKMEAAHGH